jgi:uncharacterized membrane protein
MTDKHDDESHEDDKVGYKKPPKKHKFKPGQSGNPKGRPKGTHNFKTDLVATLRMSTPVTQDGKRRQISTQQAVLFRLREKALKGDSRALDRFVELARHYNDDAPQVENTETLSDQDQAILDNYFSRSTAPEPANTPKPTDDPEETK